MEPRINLRQHGGSAPPPTEGGGGTGGPAPLSTGEGRGAPPDPPQGGEGGGPEGGGNNKQAAQGQPAGVSYPGCPAVLHSCPAVTYPNVPRTTYKSRNTNITKNNQNQLKSKSHYAFYNILKLDAET